AAIITIAVIADKIRVSAAVYAQGAHGYHQHDGAGPQAGAAAFQVEEFFRAQIEAKTGFSHRVVRECGCGAGGYHAVAAVRDVAKRPAVNKSGNAFAGL